MNAWLYGKCMELSHTWILYVSKFNNLVVVVFYSNGLKNMTLRHGSLSFYSCWKCLKTAKMEKSRIQTSQITICFYTIHLGAWQKSGTSKLLSYLFLWRAPYESVLSTAFPSVSAGPNIIKYIDWSSLPKRAKSFTETTANWQGMLELEPQPFRS